MSATIPNEMKMKELLKSTGYDCPDNMQGKTFTEATSGGGNEDFCVFTSQYVGRTYASAIAYSYSNVSKISYTGDIGSSDITENISSHLSIVSDNLISVTLTLTDGTVVEGVKQE